MKYTIIIEETVSEELTLEAANEKEAMEEARRLYRQGRGCWSREIWWK